jgi:hypothetical protein
MQDQISHLAHELSKVHNFNKLKHHVKRILLSDGIINTHSKLDIKHVGKNTDNCYFGCTIMPEQNNLKKKIEILIKPDHSGCRQLRVFIQVGNNLITNRRENEDKEKWNDRRVFDKEAKDAEKDIRTAFRKAA